MNLIQTACAAVALSIVPTVSVAQPGWLPEELKDAIITELARSLRAVDPNGTIVPGDGLSTARAGINGTLRRIESLQATGLVELTPKFPMLELPDAGSSHINALAGWGLCSLPAFAAYADSSSENGSLQRRITGAAMTATVSLVSVFLRHEYQKAGVTDEQVQAYYADPDVASALAEVRSSGELLLQTMEQCAGPLNELMQ